MTNKPLEAATDAAMTTAIFRPESPAYNTERAGEKEKASHVITAFLTALPVDLIAREIHEAKIRSCWPKSMQNREPWDKANSAMPDQPWHDIARDEAKAVLKTLITLASAANG